MLPLLTALQSQKYEHENIAKYQLIRELKNPIIKAVFEQGGFGSEHRIVVFGRSGVGKTTLILKLLGAKSPADDSKFNLINLGENIRGNIFEGGAGTVTVYRYKVSHDECGCITLPGSKIIYFQELEVLKQNLQQIRHKVEQGEWNFNDPVTITLPKQYFKAGDNIPWVITDIPGINSTSKAEYGHVSDLVKAYVLQCNVLLVLEHSIQIAQLKSLKIPDFGSWNYFGRRCRLIVTHAMSEESVKSKFRAKGLLSTQELLEHYYKTLKDEGIDLENINGIYPLDYGHSWEGIKEGERKLFNNVNLAMMGVENALKESLTQSMRPEEEFKSLMDIKHLEDKFSKDCKKYRDTIRELNALIEKCESNITIEKGKIQLRESDNNELKNEKAKWESRIINLFENPWNSYKHDDEAYDKNHPNGHNEFWNSTKEKFREWVKTYSEPVFNARNKIDELLLSKFQNNYPPFNSSWRKFSEGWKDWDESYKHTFFGIFGKNSDRTDARKAHRKAVRDGLEHNFTFWTEKINQVTKEELNTKIWNCDDLIAKNNKAIEFSNNEIKNDLDTIVRNHEEITKTQTELDSLEKSKQEDLSAFSELYPRFRKQELLKACENTMTLAKSARTPTESVQFLAFTNQIIQLSKTISN